MRRILVPILVLAAFPATARPAYVGKWAETRDAKCSEPLLLTDTTMAAVRDDSWQRSFHAAGEGGRSWTCRMKCATEGEDWKQTQVRIV